ncbi:MAG: CDGSH iron-sulfur domain-containing protein [Flavobacterium sp.]|nr:CDGSH iron-sulfur domain-containing protein [Flavobacterium sp.]
MNKKTDKTENTNVKVTVLANGPIMVEGSITVVKKDDGSETKEQKNFLCRCGHSQKKPYCDGSHKSNNFQD